MNAVIKKMLVAGLAIMLPTMLSAQKITGYAGVLHPLVTFSDGETNSNFNNSYTVGTPMGINLWKSPAIGFSMEFVPLIRFEGGSSKMHNLVFHPGVLVALGRGYTFAGRLAFETSGRYGLTPVFNKVVKKNTDSNFFVAVPLPVRFGNEHPASFSIGFQFGISF